MTTGEIIALLAALGMGGVLAKFVEAVIAYFQGRQKEEHNAWAERDKEASQRRALEELLHETRRVALEHGVELKDLPNKE